MNKINRRKEIKQKEELQAKFQLAISQTNVKVTNWLNPLKSSNQNNDKNEASEDFSRANSTFFDLPIIPSGSGLYSLDAKNGKEEYNKISDFLNSGEAGLRKLKNNSDQNETIVNGRPQGNSKAMNALINKMRNDSRDKIRQNITEKQVNQNQKQNKNQWQKSNQNKNSENNQSRNSFMSELKRQGIQSKNERQQNKNQNQLSQHLVKDSVSNEVQDDSDSNSDDELSKFKNRSVKKGANPLFGAKISKKGKGRPF